MLFYLFLHFFNYTRGNQLCKFSGVISLVYADLYEPRNSWIQKALTFLIIQSYTKTIKEKNFV